MSGQRITAYPLKKLIAMSKLRTNRPFRASVRDDYTINPGRLTTAFALLAFGEPNRRQEFPMTPARWGRLLYRMGFMPSHIAEVQARLCECYVQPLSLDEWAALFEQLAIEQLAADHVLATKYPDLR